MDINALESSSEGRLISIKRKNCSFIAPTKSGIIKFNRSGEVTELGLDHNTTLKLNEPMAFNFMSCNDLIVTTVTRGRAILHHNSLSIKYKINTDKGRINAFVRIDANEDSEVVITVRLISRDTKFIKGNISMTFNLMGEFVEMINSSKLKLAVLSNDNDDLCVINSITNVKEIIVDSKVINGAESNTCIVTSEEVINKDYYVPMIVKIGLKQTHERANSIKLNRNNKLKPKKKEDIIN